MLSDTLYRRLGGYDAIVAVVDDLLARLKADAQLGRFWQHRGEDGVLRERQLLINFLCSSAGGSLGVEHHMATDPEEPALEPAGTGERLVAADGGHGPDHGLAHRIPGPVGVETALGVGVQPGIGASVQLLPGILVTRSGPVDERTGILGQHHTPVDRLRIGAVTPRATSDFGPRTARRRAQRRPRRTGRHAQF